MSSSWYQAQRNVQTAADGRSSGRRTGPTGHVGRGLGRDTYANDNASGLSSWAPTFPDTATIDVSLSKTCRFAGLAGRLRRHSHRSRARARDRRHARQQKNLAAIVVIQDLACKTDEDNCFGPDHTKDLDFDGAPGGSAAPDSSTSRVTARR